MKTYTFITVLLLFLILCVFIFGAMVTPNEKPPFFLVALFIGAILNFGVWVSINVSNQFKE